MQIKNWHANALIFCVVWAVYYPALFAPLCSVDDLRMVTDLTNRPEIGWSDVWFPKSVTYYRPLISGSFILNLLLWNLETPFLHFENILLHWLNVWLVFVLTRLVARRLVLDEVKVPLVAALIFALHPINTEAVIWIAGRADLFAGTFVLLCLVSTFKFLQSAHRSWLLAVLISFFAGCLAKETALFVFPGVVFLSLLLRQHARSLAHSAWAWSSPALACLLGAGGYFVLRLYALRNRDLGLQHLASMVTPPPVNPDVIAAAQPHQSTGELLWVNVQTAVSVAGFYARKIVQPLPLNFGIIDVPAGYFWVGCILILFGLYLMLRLTWPGCFLLTAMSLGSIAVLVALGDISWTPIAERYMYTPAAMTAIGVSIAGAGVLRRVESDRWHTVVSCCLPMLLFALGGTVLQRGFVWQDNLTLFADTVEKSPDFALARNELATALWQRGRSQEALALVAELDVPDTQQASLNKVLVHIEEGRLEEARLLLLNKLQSEHSAAYRATIMKQLEKISEMRQRRTEDPNEIVEYKQERLVYLNQLLQGTRDPFYHYRIGQLQMSLGDKDGAQKSFAAAFALLPEGSLYKGPAGKLAESLLER